MKSQRRYVLELIVESIRLIPGNEDMSPRDIRLSVALTDFPVVHIAPRDIEFTISDGTIPFGMTGKLCEFALSRAQLESTNLLLFALREITTVNDHVILTMTAPISLRDLILSLPSGPDQASTPFAKRKFAFIDNTGECEVMLRVSSPPPVPKPVRSVQRSSRKTPLPVSPPKPTPTVKQLAESVTKEIEDIAVTSYRQSYGGLRKRTPIIL